MAKFTQYRTFIAVTDTGSLSAASKALNMTPSAASKQIGALEEALGVTLFERSNKRMSPTAQGRAFYEECVAIVRHIDRAETEIKHHQQAVVGRITVSFPSSLARARCFELFSLFGEAFPEVRLDLRLSDEVDELSHSDIDFAFRLGAVSKSSLLVTHPLVETQVILCAASAYVDRMGTLESIADIARHRLVLTRPQKASEQIRNYIKENKLSLSRRDHHITSDGEASYQLVKRGLAMGMFPNLMVADDLESGALSDVFPAASLPSKWLHLVSKKQAPEAEKNRQFAQFVRRYFSK